MVDHKTYSLIRKIKLQRGIQDISLEKYTRVSTLQKVISTTSSSFITLIVFADFGIIHEVAPELSGTPVMITIGIISFLIFLSSLFSDIFGVQDKTIKCTQTIERYTLLLNEIIQDSELDDSKLRAYSKRYLEISNSSQKFTNREFISLKRKYYMNIVYSRIVSDNPFIRGRHMKKEAKENYLKYLKQDGQWQKEAE